MPATRCIEREVDQVTPAGADDDDEAPAQGTTRTADVRERLPELCR